MTEIERTVFISYRRVNKYMARSVYENLVRDGYDVFLDIENINSGDFEQVIFSSIESRSHFVMILTPSALERCQNPNDVLLREIQHAIQCKRNIIPLAFSDFNFSEMDKFLPTEVSSVLRRYNAITVSDDYFPEAMEKLKKRFLNVSLDMVVHPPKTKTINYEEKQKELIEEQPKVKKAQLSSEQYFERGFRHYEMGNYQFAIDDYSEAIKLVSEFSEAYSNRGSVYLALGDIQSAINDYSSAIEHDELESKHYYNRGFAYRQFNNLRASIDDYTSAIRLKPDYEKAYNNRGFVYLQLKEYDKAISDYSKAIVVGPPNAGVYNDRGCAYFEKGDIVAAKSDFEMALKLDPNLEQARKNLGGLT